MMTIFMMTPLCSDPASVGMMLLAKVAEYEWALTVPQQSIHHCVASLFLTLRTGSAAGAPMNPLMLETPRLSSLYHIDTFIHLLSSSCIQIALESKSYHRPRFRHRRWFAHGERGRVMSLQLWMVPSDLQGNNNWIKVCDPVTSTLWPALVCQRSNKRRDNGKTILAATQHSLQHKVTHLWFEP